MTRERVVVAGAVGVGVCTALGVAVSSQVVLGEPLEAWVNASVQAGLIATFVFLAADYARRTLL